MKKYLKYIPFLLFAFTLFGNLKYPLLWNDEAETAMHSKRVLEYGYPKVHGEKNVVYPIRHSNKEIAIHKGTDAYIGNMWGMFYFGVIGELLAKSVDDIYNKTMLLRLPFVLIGLIGILIFYQNIKKLTYTKREKHILFVTLFLALVIQIDFALHLREVRYYSLVIFILSLLFRNFLKNRVFEERKQLKYIVWQTLWLFLLYNVFPPVFVASIMFLIAFEVIRWFNESELKKSILFVLPTILSITLLIPIVIFFDTFHFSAETAAFHNFNLKVYGVHLRDSFLYFYNVGQAKWTIGLGLIILFLYLKKKILPRNTEYAFLLFTLFAVIYFFVINYIPHLIFTRYLMPIILVEKIILVLEIIILYKHLKTSWFSIVAILLFISTIYTNVDVITGRIHEITHQYKGPLDYEIPYIMNRFPNTEDLVIATNYEECSYMYYLGSKVTMGFVLNNMEEDLKVKPNIIIFRHDWAWNYEKKVFEPLFKMGNYDKIEFPIYDNPYNNVPDLNLDANNHLFHTKTMEQGEHKAHIWVEN